MGIVFVAFDDFVQTIRNHNQKSRTQKFLNVYSLYYQQ